MSLEGLEEPWGQLVSTERPEGEEEERLPLLGSQFQIGRDKGQQACQQLLLCPTQLMPGTNTTYIRLP